ncbi:hypothetical protein ACFX2K_046215 [Malus domestica]
MAAVMTCLLSVHTHTFFDSPYVPEDDVVEDPIAAAEEKFWESIECLCHEINLQMFHLSVVGKKYCCFSRRPAQPVSQQWIGF